MFGCKPVATPLVVNEKLRKDDDGKKIDAAFYRSLIRKLLYLTVTRLDIMFAVSLLSRFITNPSHIHLGVAKRVLRYLQGALDYGIKFSSNTNMKLIGFCDSDWGGCKIGRAHV